MRRMTSKEMAALKKKFTKQLLDEMTPTQRKTELQRLKEEAAKKVPPLPKRKPKLAPAPPVPKSKLRRKKRGS